MSDDAVSRAARALRDAYGGDSRRSRATRSSVLAAASRKKRRRILLVAVGMPMAAIFLVSSAWAAATGRVSAWVAFWRRKPTVTVTAPESASRPAPASVSTAAAAPMPASVSEPVPARTPAPVSVSAPVRTLAPASVPAPTPASPTEDSLYSTAHHAHFTSRDPAAALAAWDAYLARFPNGRFAPEANYNRALSLVRLGRLDEARTALVPIAEGENGAYRRVEARELLEALDAGP